MPLILGKSGVNRELKEIYLGNSGVNKKEKELYLGKGRVNKQIYQNALFTLASVPVDGVARQFATPLFPKTIEFDASVNLGSHPPRPSVFAGISFGLAGNGTGNLSLSSEYGATGKGENIELDDQTTLFGYSSFTGGVWRSIHLGGSSYLGHIKIELIGNTFYLYKDNTLIGSAVLTDISSFQIIDYSASVSSGRSATFTNLVIK